ncbi:hydroxymethylglutaryl-CoA lyase [Mesorhizobium sp. M7A.F.Ca.US.011.01.1.1]|uniref:hydroxymethylglutaryl-CoA lyase n=1 Tax=unclassified Mesorhizobium TaxID=325217 RepID=UPI000FCCD39C|nr:MULTISPECIES: hydroxymethylglutaryl-CoA lyase [unclassified Mesorhizobium]RUW90277.1 hydroxymethylglutaryl-CoA lyase [Mesorhizobium sp. M7A.F.Ca.US.010.02.1.1]RUX25396.1 hydroxymethylglutaryl-CoA lyase [Mesorhizobium sp. M7A.F.Ca.US.011.01.1.1]
MSGDRKVTIVEVGPRDGLQNEKSIVSTEDKLKLIRLLADAGLSRIEVTAFVSPAWVPQMADHDAVMRRTPAREGLIRSVLVPNDKGAIAAIAAGADQLAVFTSASETFASRNINCTIAESLERFVPVISLAKSHGIPVRGYVSCAVECPYEGEIAPDVVAMVCSRLMQLGCFEIAVADTIGRGSPEQVDAMLARVLEVVPASMLACHFHDTFGRALENIDVALERTIATFDSSAGGLGGCPYAPGSAGNVATGAVVSHLSQRSCVTGINPAELEFAEAFALGLRA